MTRLTRIAATLLAIALLLLALLVGSLPIPANAQPSPCPVGPACTPETEHDRTKCTALLSGEEATGQWSAYWYRYTTAAGSSGWCNKTFACLTRYCPGTAQMVLQARTVLSAAADLAAGLAELDARFGVKPASGTQEDFDFQTLLYKACQAAAANPPPGFQNLTCPLTAPVPPVAPSIWRVNGTGSSVYPVVNGKLGVPIAGKRAAGNTLCSCTMLKVLSGTYTYCAYDGSAANEVALCIKAAQ